MSKYAMIFILLLVCGGLPKQIGDTFSRRDLATAADCVTCLNSSQKWCKYNSSSSTATECCALGSTTSTCGGSSSYICSNDSTKMTQNSGKTLCPTDYSSCGSQSKKVSSSTSPTFSSSTYGTSTVCHYEMESNGRYTNTVEIKIDSTTQNVVIEVYHEDIKTGVFTYKGTLTSGGSGSYSVDTNDSIFVIAIPTSSSAKIKFTAKGKEKKSLSAGAIVGITIGCACFCLCVIGCIIGIVLIAKKMRNKQMNSTNVASATVMSNYPQQNQSNYYNQTQVASNIQNAPGYYDQNQTQQMYHNPAGVYGGEHNNQYPIGIAHAVPVHPPTYKV